MAFEDRCPVCRRPAAAAGRPWLLRSRHATSLGEVDYCVGPCGCLVVLLDGVLIKSATPARR
jgi:hypothetical protein